MELSLALFTHVLTCRADHSNGITASEPELWFSSHRANSESSSLSLLPLFLLQKYEDAARAFREVLKVDSSCVEASQELWRVQIAQLMVCSSNVFVCHSHVHIESTMFKMFFFLQLYGFTRAQSSNALSIHGTVKEAAEFLAKMSNKPGQCLQRCLYRGWDSTTWCVVV